MCFEQKKLLLMLFPGLSSHLVKRIFCFSIFFSPHLLVPLLQKQMQRNLSAECASYVSVLGGSCSCFRFLVPLRSLISYCISSWIQAHYDTRFNPAHVIIPALLRPQKYNVALFRFSINKSMMLRKELQIMHIWRSLQILSMLWKSINTRVM